MTYSANLDPSAPGQGEFARLGAGRIRALTLALKERLASIFVDPDADPLVFKPSAVKLTDIKHVIYTLPFITPASILPAGAVTVLSQASILPIGTPTVWAWEPMQTAGPDTEVSNLIIGAAWHDGTNVNLPIKNSSGSSVDLNGSNIKVYSFPLT